MALFFSRRNTPTPPQPQANQASAGGAATTPPPQATAALNDLRSELQAHEATLEPNLVKAKKVLSAQGYAEEADKISSLATSPVAQKEVMGAVREEVIAEREAARTALKATPEWGAHEAAKTALKNAEGRKRALEELIQENNETRFGRVRNWARRAPVVGGLDLKALDREIKAATRVHDRTLADLKGIDQYSDFVSNAEKKHAVVEGVSPYMKNVDAIGKKTEHIERLEASIAAPAAAPAAEPVAAVETAAAEVPAAKPLTTRQLKQQMRELGHDIQKAERQAVGDIAAGHFGGARKAVEKAQDLITAGKFDEAQALFKRAKGLQLEGAGLINEMKPVTRLGKAWHFTKGAGKWGAIGTGVAAGAGLLYAALKPSERSSDDGAMQDLSHRMAENDARMQALQSMTPPVMQPQVVMVPAPQSGFVGRLEAERGAPVMAYADPAARPQPRVLDAQSQGGQWVVPPQQAVQVVGA